MKLILLLLVLISASCELPACDMFGLILTSDGSFSQQENIVNEYFDFLISRSSASSNNDGYGVVAYRRGSTELTSADYWYKMGSYCWYGDGSDEPLDAAWEAILTDENDYYLVIAHARNATGGSGSHPFRVNAEGRTYTMCHNGVISFTLRQAIMNYLGEVWFEHHPSNWFGVYGDTGSFIDSELYTHYLVNSVLAADGESWQGLIAAYTREELMGVEPASYFLQARCSANMLFSDGTGLFAFRNTYLTSSQRLSWQNYGDMIGIKTRDAEANTLEQNELIKFCGGGEVVSEILEYEETEDFVPAADFYAQPNPFYGAVDIYYVPARSDDNENDEENGNADFVDIYNIRGRKIRSISSALQNNDYRTYHWDGFMDSGFRAPAGIYLYRHKRSGSAGKLVMYK